MMETARLISNRHELIEFLNTLAEESFFDKINCPDTKWKVVDIPNITFYENHIKDAPLGALISLPDYIKTTMVYKMYMLVTTYVFSVVWQCTKVQTLVGANNLPKICFVNIVFILMSCQHIFRVFNFLILFT